jgi:hypothetical protein
MARAAMERGEEVMLGFGMTISVAHTLAAIGILVGLTVSPACEAQEEAERCGALPAAVIVKRDSLRAAAAASDYQAMAKLADDSEFIYSFGDEDDPAAYWQSLKADGVDIPQIVVALLDMPCAKLTYDSGTEFVWPSANEIPYAELTTEEIDALQAIYNGKLEENYLEGPEVGYYVGWRLFIAEDGRWTTLVAGD